MKGTVMKSTGSWYEVLGDDGKDYHCRIRGKIRLEDIKETNPVSVGDFVEIETGDDEEVITAIMPRENYIVRQSVKKTGHTNVIAANIDQTLLVASISLPRTSPGFIDRFAVAAESFRIPQVLVFNKMDLWGDEETLEVDKLVSLYEKVGLTCIRTSAMMDEQGALQTVLKGKKTLIAGHSGVGKSTLINRLFGNTRQKTSEVSEYTMKGTHTTTFAEMLRIDGDTFIIDTPGIKELGLVDMSPEEVSDYFPEMRDLRLNCKFGSKCLHLTEPKCAIKPAVEDGRIAESRYNSYVNIVTGKDNRK